MTVNILMATYNGERYLAEQIESIQKQTFADWTLYIRDDGSTDQTRDIIKQFEHTDRRIVFVNPDNTENLGVIKSFYTLVKQAKADYYFFSDQDDIWLPEKLEKCLAEAESFPATAPLLVYTDLKVVDQSLTVLSESMIKSQSDHANTELVQELTENTVTGGTMMINHALAERWDVADNLLMHDWYLGLLAAAMGNLVYLDIPTELYRQHENNVLGARTLSKRMKNWARPHRLIAKYWWLIDASQKQAKHLLRQDLAPENRELVEQFITILDQPFRNRLKVLKQYGFRKNRAFHTLVFRTLITTKLGYGSYRKHGYTK